ncbi:MAG: APC family permease [Vulcanisaeta sp.]|uniref:APC family permease n=1 Tax=Vulcanisaeta sp. TaxID=2020871 RepID=UPI003D0D9184
MGVENTGRESNLRKELGVWSLTFLAIGAILGPAVAYVPAYVLAYSGPSGLLSWLSAFIMLFITALVFVELGTMWPKAGAVAYYPYRSNGALAGVLNGWPAFIGYSLIMPASLTAVVEYLSFYFPSLYANGVLTYLGVIVAIILGVIVFIIHMYHIGILGNINNALTLFKALSFLIPLIALLAYFNPINLNNPKIGGFAPFGAPGFFAATTATVFAYLGFRQPVNYAEEVKNPSKDIPLAIMLALIITMIYYMIESLAFLGVVDRGIVTSASSWSSITNLAYPYVTAIQVTKMPAANAFIAIIIIAALVAAYTDALIYYGSAARIGYALAKYDRMLPQLFTKLNRQGMPFYSNILVFIVGLIYLALFPSFASVFLLFTDAVLISYAPAAVSLLVFRKVYPNEHRPFRMPMASILAPIAFIVSTLLIYWSGWQAVEISVISALVGLFLLYFYNKYVGGIKKEEIYGGLWLLIYLLALMAVAYFGSTNLNVIPSPWDTVVVVVLSIIFFYWGYYSGVRYNMALLKTTKETKQ